MMTKIKITGSNNVIDFSADAKYIITGGYDGSFKVFDTAKNKLYCKTKVKGPSNDIIIHYQDISADNKYAAFSTLGKVFLMDISKKEIIWEYEFSIAERVLTNTFCFFNQCAQLLIPDGSRLLIYDIENEIKRYIALPEGAGHADCIAVNHGNTHLAYKSSNGSWDLRYDSNGKIVSYCDEYKEDMSDRIFIYNVATGKCSKIIKIPYPKHRSAQICKNMKFIDNETLLILRENIGFSYFNINSGKEIDTINWNKKGFEYGDFEKAKIYENGRFVLFRNEIPNKIEYDDDGNVAYYTTPYELMEYILYDTKEDKIIYRKKNRLENTAFHPDTKQFAFLTHEIEENNKYTKYLCIETITMKREELLNKT